MIFAAWQRFLFLLLLIFLSILVFPRANQGQWIFPLQRHLNKEAFYLEKKFYQDPDNAANAKKYLISLLELDDLEQFEKSKVEILGRHPYNYELLKLLADVYEYLQEPAQASLYWEQMLFVRPNDQKTQKKLTEYLLLQDQKPRLLKYYEGKMQQGIASEKDLELLVTNYAYMGSALKVKKYSYRGVKKYAENPLFWKFYIWSLETLNRNDHVLSVYAQYLVKFPGDEEMTLNFARELIRFQRQNKAIFILEGMLTKYPDNLEVFEMILDLYAQTRSKQELLNFLEFQTDILEENPFYIKNTAILYQQVGYIEKAIEYLKWFHQKTGGDYQSHQLLGDIYASQGKETESRLEYEQALQKMKTRNEKAFHENTASGS